jgi:hypothetical protein
MGVLVLTVEADGDGVRASRQHFVLSHDALDLHRVFR